MRRAIRFAETACIACLGIGAAVVACSSFGDATSEDTAEAGQDGANGSDAQATTDAPAAETGGDAGDAGADVVTDATTTRLCAEAGHWLCDDFDRDAALGFPTWDLPLIIGAGSVAIAPLASAPSSPNVFTSKAGELQRAQVGKGRTGTASTFRCELDMFVEARGASNVSLFEMDVGGTDFYYRVDLRGGPDSITHYGGFGGVATGVIGRAVLFQNAWQHITVALGATASPAVDVTLDGASVTHANVDAGATPVAAFTTETVVAGVYGVGSGAGDWLVHYDNVFCDL